MSDFSGHQGVDITGHVGMLASLDARMTAMETARGAELSEFRDAFERVHELERKVDTMTLRMERYEDEFRGIRKDLSLISEKQDTLKERTPSREEWNELKKAVSGLKDKPINTWNKIKTVVLTIAASGIVYFILSQLFPAIFTKGGAS